MGISHHFFIFLFSDDVFLSAFIVVCLHRRVSLLLYAFTVTIPHYIPPSRHQVYAPLQIHSHRQGGVLNF